jgi:putative addiction module antidote
MFLEVKRIGNSTGVILPKELLARLQLELGDKLFITERPGGGFTATPTDPKFEKGMEAARKAMKRYRNALTELAK